MDLPSLLSCKRQINYLSLSRIGLQLSCTREAIKRESGESPEQSRCCKFIFWLRAIDFIATGKQIPGRRSQQEQVRRPTMQTRFTAFEEKAMSLMNRTIRPSFHSHLVKIDSRTDAVATTYDEKVLSFAIDGPIAYLYTYDYQTKDSAIKVFDLNAGTVIRDNFITDGTAIQTPFSIQLNPFSGNVYITEAYNYTVKGDVLCFNQQGQLQYRLNDIGLNPNTVVFSDKASQNEAGDTPEDPNAPSAFANKVFEYIPAPGQFINTTTSAYEDGFSAGQVLERATEKLKKKSVISLGGFGGTITVGFHQSIRNSKGEYDFRILGNASYNQNTGTGALGGSAEPGIVLVSKDENGNGLPDDEWYELAGSEYGKDTETRNYEITYYRPQPANGDVRWTDNQGGEGFVYRNSYHQQDSYYPNWIEEDEITFRGTRLKDNAINEGGTWVGYCYPWGYADNHPNRSEFSQFKIDWAVDQNGNHVELDKIDFVKIYTAVNQNVGWMGEISTEVMTVEDLHFEN